MELNFNLIESVHELNRFNCDAITCLTSFVVGGCESGNVYNIFFETGKGKYCYQTLDVSDYISAQDFVFEWSRKRVNLIISAINNHSRIIIGAYTISQEGISIDGDIFCWKDSFLIFDGIRTILKNNSTGKAYSIDNTEDFWGYLITCLLHPSPTQEVKEAKAKWVGRDLIAEQAEKNKIEAVLHLQALERNYLESIFRGMVLNALNNSSSVMYPASDDCDPQDTNQSFHREIWKWDEFSDDELEVEKNNDAFGSVSSYVGDWELESGSLDDELLLDDFDIDYVYHITHYSNFQNILRNGLRAHGNRFVVNNIDNAAVNKLRSKSEPIFNRSIHSYVPFYFNPKNPMLYVNKHRQNDILILAFNRNLLTRKGVVFTDGNAAKDKTHFYKDLSDLDKLNWDCLHASSWADFENGKSDRMAEVLVEKKVGIEHIEKIYCFDKETYLFIKDIDNAIDVEINKELYF
ncbi:DUF4433 domain-containing protein [Neptuniibacter sp.]|uniref:DUF4433 domain-containing protein n=1 Tax=Neptuniibacter sp. TaxID=1962643 RepID=UPI00260995CA|nr:DUF4433 domain-containing protein [Neptuniibacter sp.]MCP4596143.1 DUF4433 domain-containing protein [Neptuniibacter sp.]